MKIFLLERYLRKHMGAKFDSNRSFENFERRLSFINSDLAPSKEELTTRARSEEERRRSKKFSKHNDVIGYLAARTTTILMKGEGNDSGDTNDNTPFLEKVKDLFAPLIINPYKFNSEQLESLYRTWLQREFLAWLKFGSLIFLSTSLYHPYMDILTYCDSSLVYKSPTLCLPQRNSWGFFQLRMISLGIWTSVFTIFVWFGRLQNKPKLSQWVCAINFAGQGILAT
jgi:hypothetical protein